MIDAVAGYTPAAERSRRTARSRTATSSATSTGSSRSAPARRPAVRTCRPATRAGRSRHTSDASTTRLLNRYLFTVTGRRDGSSRFGADHQWGVFPSAAFGWRVSDEPFMAKFPGDRAAQAPRLDRHRRQPVDPAVSVDGAPAARSSTCSAAPSSRATTRRRSPTRTSAGKHAADRLRPGPRPVGRPLSLTADYYQQEDERPAARGQPAVRVRLRDRAAERGRGEQQRLRARPDADVLDDKKGPVGWTTTFNYSRNRTRCSTSATA